MIGERFCFSCFCFSICFVFPLGMRVKKARKERKQEGKPPLETARFHEILQEEFIDNQVPEVFLLSSSFLLSFFSFFPFSFLLSYFNLKQLLGKAFKVLMEALQKASVSFSSLSPPSSLSSYHFTTERNRKKFLFSQIFGRCFGNHRT